MAKPGPKTTIFGTPERLEEIRTLGGKGLNVTQIRSYYDVPASTWADIIEREPEVLEALMVGKNRTLSFVAGKLMELVQKGNLGAIIFYLKTQARWRETDRPWDVNNEDKPQFPAITLTVNDPLEAARIYQKIMTET